MAQSDTKTMLTPRQVEALEALMNRGVGETLEALAIRAGVSRRTLHRYLRDADFHAEYRARVALEFCAQRGCVAHALVKGAITPGPGQVAMQRIFWQLQGELSERVEMSGAGGGPIEVRDATVADLSALSVETKRMMIRDLEAPGATSIDIDGEELRKPDSGR